MSSFLIRSGRTYSLDLEIVKSPSTSHISSPSSTLSESSNSPLAISTRKQRTPRKRPNQTYNEATVLLSTAYPNVFPPKTLIKPHKFTSPHGNFFDESSEMLLPFRVIDQGHDSGFLPHPYQPIEEKTNSLILPYKVVDFSCQEVDSGVSSVHLCSELNEEFDAESILDERIGEGIDSIMGNLSVDNEQVDAHNDGNRHGNPMGFGFGGKFEFPTRGVRAWRRSDEGNWWNFPTVDMRQISPRITTNKVKKEKKKKKKKVVEIKDPDEPKENPNPKPNTGLQLKLNYDEVLNAWSDRSCPFADDADSPGSHVSARLAQMDLFCEEGGGVREASELRYKAKRRTQLFSKKVIRCQVRKANADRRPRNRMKGRLVRRLSSSGSEDS
ncbi:hypothetical protein SLA2020_036250 [Shorea laevis]